MISDSEDDSKEGRGARSSDDGSKSSDNEYDSDKDTQSKKKYMCWKFYVKCCIYIYILFLEILHDEESRGQMIVAIVVKKKNPQGNKLERFNFFLKIRMKYFNV